MTAIVDRAAYPYLLPPFGEPLRVLFAGRRSAFDACLPPTAGPRIRPAFVELRSGFDRAAFRMALRRATPHVAVLFEPHAISAGLLDGTRAAAVAFVSETAGRELDPGDYDRVVSVNRVGSDTRLWRSLPLPINDRFYAPVTPFGRPPRALVLAEETSHRESILIRAKHEYDVLHYAHGLWGRRLRDVLAQVDIGINVHRDRTPTFESDALLHLAAGNLLLSEPLMPLHGLEPGIDFLTFESRDELLATLFQLRERPGMHERVRLRGRAKADDYRASRVWARLIDDLILDIAAFGTERRVS